MCKQKKDNSILRFFSQYHKRGRSDENEISLGSTNPDSHGKTVIELSVNNCYKPVEKS